MPYTRNSHGTNSMTLPHYTFSGSMVYISVFMPCGEASSVGVHTDCVYKLNGNLAIAATDKTSGRALSQDPTIAASRCTINFCNQNGNCIDDPQDGEHAASAYCICDDGWTGARCDVGNQWGAGNGPTIATNANILASVETGYVWADQVNAANLAAVTSVTSVRLANTEPNIAHYYVGARIELIDDDVTKSGTGGLITSYDASQNIDIDWTDGTAPVTSPDTGTTYKIAAACRTGNTAQLGSTITATAVDTVTAGSAGAGNFGFDATNNLITGLAVGDTILIAANSNGACSAAGSYTVTAVDSSSPWEVDVAETVPSGVTAANCEMSRPDVCITGNEWDTPTKTCKRKSVDLTTGTRVQHVWEPYFSVGADTVVKTDVMTGTARGPCTTLFSPGFASSGDANACQALCDANSKCNAFTWRTGSGTKTCELHSCPKGFAQETTSVTDKSSYVKAAYTCCASGQPTLDVSTNSCPNALPGIYDEATCETVVGAATEAVCETVAGTSVSDTSGTTCSIVPSVANEAACELTPYAEIPPASCPLAAVQAGISDCDAFDPVRLDCATQKCSPTGTNAYKIGYVACPGGVCTINAPKPVLEIPYSVKNLPAHAKVVAYVDSNPYPSKGANVVNYVNQCESSDAACIADTAVPGFADSLIKIYDLKPLSGAKKHTLVLMLLTESGEPLGTEVKQFQVGYGGGCSVAPDGTTCGGNGACYLGYCVCYDGWYGSACGNSVEEDGSFCALKSGTTKAGCETQTSDWAAQSFECKWSTTTTPVPDSATQDLEGICTASLTTVAGFKPGDAYEKRVAKLTQSKLGEARFLNTRMLESTSAAISKSNEAMTSAIATTNSKLKTHATTVQTELSTTKAATQAKVDALYAKMERNAIVIQQAREESLRSQTSNLEAKLELQRALADHQTEVQNRFQTKRFGVYKLNALKQDKLKQEFARSRFTINQLKTANGPLVDTTQFKESTCTTDQFYNVACTEATTNKQSLYTGTGYVSAQTVLASGTTATSNPVVNVNGADVPGTYNSVLRG
jgi:hypothetical protein